MKENIDIEKTIKEFGYDPETLGKYSKRKIIYLCNKCGETSVRIYRDALKGLNCRFCYKRSQVTKKEVAEDILRVIKLLHHQPDSKEYMKYGIYTYKTVKKIFNVTIWHNIFSVLKLKQQVIKNKRFYQAEEITKELNLVYGIIGHFPTRKEFRELSAIDYKTCLSVLKCKHWYEIIEKYFSHLDLDIYKYKIGAYRYKPKEFYLESLRKLALKIGKVPTTIDAKNNRIYTDIFYNRFKVSWIEILKLAGLDINKLPEASSRKYKKNIKKYI